ncbi:alpha/beta hydrolase [Candidatus Mycobacterium methanotrophicum]|uniref:Alpha/beta hydrolase n=1 Tax=Candidatus Mycobacterium methanotrophicum TaxID=2943498 RepID=A0ABY4QTJ7_9MYCO|nr:alpha/beta hydrolase [Candidatus Mycobacterium methanotrophicum]UQX13224.1 alpha/beta hydrolase [Candidatus Mycobacterium methanotrophicum]
MTTVDGFPIQVSDTGPDQGSVVVLLAAAQRAPAAYDAVCGRLHTASLRTIVVGSDPRLTPKSVMGILDVLDIDWGVLVGDRVGGELAWELAATRLDRFTGLVVIDRGHPRVADAAGVIRDNHCPPVEINTTALVSMPATQAVARASQRFVYGDYRVVELLTRRNAYESTAQLAAEIVLRTSTW